MLIFFLICMIVLACCYAIFISTVVEAWDCFGWQEKTLDVIILVLYTYVLFLIVVKLYKIFILAL
ncbi:hypothetical protein FUSNEC_GEN_300_09315 [Fusobacterium necrophorum subsp. funduliforme]